MPIGRPSAAPWRTKLGMANAAGAGLEADLDGHADGDASGAHPRSRPATRTPGWSANSTSTTAYGTSRSGSQRWWLTVKL